ncbi:MAG: hypothetical protein PHC64_00230 [Candidatus Gastranaerophilales bacterium]|nr:hypothetical protein [Candidatus Gastranaerophilales bacterium]
MKKLKSQNLLEYVLIAAMIAIAGYFFMSKFDFNTIKHYVFTRPIDSSDSTKIKIEAMTK